MGNTPNVRLPRCLVKTGNTNNSVKQSHKSMRKSKAFVPGTPNSRIPPGSPRPEDLFSNEELKSARLVAMQGPFVEPKTGELLSQFYQKYAPDKDDDEHIGKIIQSGMELSMLNQKLRDKYGVDLDDFVLAQGGELK